MSSTTLLKVLNEMLQAHCILFYRSGNRIEYRANTMREVETYMEQAGRAARKRGDEITHHALGCCSADVPKWGNPIATQQAAKSSLQLPNAPFDE